VSTVSMSGAAGTGGAAADSSPTTATAAAGAGAAGGLGFSPGSGQVVYLVDRPGASQVGQL
jgi:hypothetical protein